MKKILSLKSYLIVLSIFLFTSCNKDSDVDCTVFDLDCIPGNSITLRLLENDMNILSQEDIPEIQSDRSSVSVYLIENLDILRISFQNETGFILTVGERRINISTESSFIDSECCSGNSINRVTIDGIEVCSGIDCISNTIEFQL